MMNDSNLNPNICPMCGASISGEIPGRDESPWDRAGLGEDTEVHILAGYVRLSSSGLITEADSFSAELLGTEKSALTGKPFNLFIYRDDMVDWFVHRNTVFTTRAPQSFEIRLCRSDQSNFKAKLQCNFVDDEVQKTGAMHIAIRDYTQRRQVLDQLEYVQNLNQIHSQITTDMIRCPARDVDAMVEKVLKTLGVFSEVDRVYFGLVDHKRQSFLPSYQWQHAEKDVPEPVRKPISLNRFPELRKAVFKNEVIYTERHPSEGEHQKEVPKQFHMKGTLSYAIFPVGDDDSGRGIIGYDITRVINGHQERFVQLFRFAGNAILNAVRRKKDETTWLRRYKKVLEAAPQAKGKPNNKAIVPTVSDGTDKTVLEYDDIPLMVDSSSGELPDILKTAALNEEKIDQSEWTYQTSVNDNDHQTVQNVRIIDNQAVITCIKCNKQDRPSQEAFGAIGTIALATCPCGYQFAIQCERRLLHRKSVELDGVFLRTQGLHFRSDSMNYSGKAQIANISKQGIGFFTVGPNQLNVGDQVRLKFTLDNQSRSLITKNVLIKGIQERYAGGQFIGADRHDITLGFYLM